MRYRPLLACVVFLGCSACLTEKMSNVDPARVKGSYTLHYDDSDHSLIGEVQFTTEKHTDGSSIADPVYIELDNGSTIAFDDKPMTEVRNFLDQITYRTILTGLPSSQVWNPHRFRYQKSEGEAQVTALTPVQVPTAGLPTGTVSQSVGFSVDWQVSQEMAVSVGESVSLQWNTVDQFPGSLLKSTGPPLEGQTSGQVVVTPQDLLSWDTGRTYYLQLCFQLQTNINGLTKTMESCNARRPIQLVP